MEQKKIFYRLNSDKFVTRQMGSEMVMVPLSNNVADMTSVLTLNEVGGDILKAFVEAATVDEVIAKLLKSYDVDEPTLKLDVEEFIEKAMARGVIDKVSI
ncbi:PqqD family protein [Marinilabilia rubra]|uniref:PqqD family protein n=1 Tax=Marinilabilia rubra TaxID=2162893 RepID=A0A2U2B603_9BACT|nr:PqqD family protein [Marinilabilia rubra]PWD98497.1 PqqD family protein [Marinilabilia rubra]